MYFEKIPYGCNLYCFQQRRHKCQGGLQTREARPNNHVLVINITSLGAYCALALHIDTFWGGQCQLNFSPTVFPHIVSALEQFPPLNSFRTFMYFDLWPYVLWPLDFQIQKRIVSSETMWGNTVCHQVLEDVMLIKSTWCDLHEALLCCQTSISSSLSSGLALVLGVLP